MVELVPCLIITRFLPFLEYKFVNDWFSVSVWNFYIGYVCQERVFFAALSTLSFPCIPMWLGIKVRMILLFLVKVFILSRSLVMRRVNVFCSVELGGLIWSG